MWSRDQFRSNKYDTKWIRIVSRDKWLFVDFSLIFCNFWFVSECRSDSEPWVWQASPFSVSRDHLKKLDPLFSQVFFEFSKPGARIGLGSGNKIAFWKNFRVFLRILNKRSSSNCYCLTPWGKVKLISKSRTPPNPERHFWKLWKKYFPLEIQLAGLRARSV